jgi:hypothetical protein
MTTSHTRTALPLLLLLSAPLPLLAAACGAASLGKDGKHDGSTSGASPADGAADQSTATPDAPPATLDAAPAADAPARDALLADADVPPAADARPDATASDSSEPPTCGGGICAAGDYCEKPCDAPASQGMCQRPPDVCLADFSPVCGCNGKTYGNACQAASDRVSVRHAGSCP